MKNWTDEVDLIFKRFGFFGQEMEQLSIDDPIKCFVIIFFIVFFGFLISTIVRGVLSK